MIDKINELSFSKSLDSNYLLSLFHSHNIETNLKLAAIVTQYESNIDFFTVFSKAKAFKMEKAFDRFKRKLQVFISELTTKEQGLSAINQYLTVVSRIVLLKSIISQLGSLSEILINASRDYINSLYSKDNSEDIKALLSQFNMFLLQMSYSTKKPISRMSTKSNTDKYVDDETKGIPTPKFVGFEPGDEQNSFSFDGKHLEQNLIIPFQLQKEEESYVNRLNSIINSANSGSNTTSIAPSSRKEPKERKESIDKPLCLETLKTINEMFQSKMITQEDRSLLKERLIEKDRELLSVLREKGGLISNIKQYLSCGHK